MSRGSGIVPSVVIVSSVQLNAYAGDTPSVSDSADGARHHQQPDDGQHERQPGHELAELAPGLRALHPPPASRHHLSALGHDQ